MIYGGPQLSRGHYIARTADELQFMVNALRSAPERCLDFETDGLKYANGKKPVGYGLGFLASDGHPYCWYVPVAHATVEPMGQANLDQAKRAFADALGGAKAILGHNLKFDLNMARANGYTIDPDVQIHDTLPQSHLAYERRSFQLEKLAADMGATLWDPMQSKDAVEAFTARRAAQRKMTHKKGKYNKPSYLDVYGHSEVPVAIEAEYCCRDIAHVLLIDKQQRSRAMGIGTHYEERRRALYWNEMMLVRALAEMEWEGQPVDEQYLIEFHHELAGDLDRRSIELTRMFNHHVEWGKDEHVRQFLYGKKGQGGLGLPVLKTTDRGHPSVDRGALLMLRQAQGGRWADQLEALGEYNARKKVQSTYTLSMARHICQDGRIHASFLQQGTKTGRLSGRDPNLQNIPMRHPILSKRVRQAFLTRGDGWCRIFADYSQVELRVLAWASGAANLIAAYNSPAYNYMMQQTGGRPSREWYDWFVEARAHEPAIDVHGLQAKNTFGVDETAADWKIKRRAAKIINFGVPYGMGPGGLMGNPELMLSEAEAKGYFKQYHLANPEIDRTKNNLFAKMLNVRGTPHFIAWSGRKCHGPELKSNDEARRAAGMRSLFATLIQGGAAELTRISLVRWYIRWRRGEISAKATSTVHDEIQFDCPDNEARENAIEIRHDMEDFHGTFGNIPIICDLEKSTTNWADKKDYHV